MIKLYLNYSIGIILILLISILIFKKNENKLVITVKPLSDHLLHNPKIVDSKKIDYLTASKILNEVKKNFNSFYLNKEIINKIEKNFKSIKIINKKSYYIVIVDIEKNTNLNRNFNQIKKIINDFSNEKIIKKNTDFANYWKKKYHRISLEYQENNRSLYFWYLKRSTRDVDFWYIKRDIQRKKIIQDRSYSLVLKKKYNKQISVNDEILNNKLKFIQIDSSFKSI